jgi:hypothetical protein
MLRQTESNAGDNAENGQGSHHAPNLAQSPAQLAFQPEPGLRSEPQLINHGRPP